MKTKIELSFVYLGKKTFKAKVNDVRESQEGDGFAYEFYSEGNIGSLTFWDKEDDSYTYELILGYNEKHNVLFPDYMHVYKDGNLCCPDYEKGEYKCNITKVSR